MCYNAHENSKEREALNQPQKSMENNNDRDRETLFSINMNKRIV